MWRKPPNFCPYPFQSMYHDGRGINGMKYRRGPTDDSKKFILQRSLFDLVNSSHYLDLDSDSLLGWYVSLPCEDRKLIQDEGGLYLFLVRHPALVVVEAIGIVHVKPRIRRMLTSRFSNLNSGFSARMPTCYGVPPYEDLETSCCRGCPSCRFHFDPPPVVEEMLYFTGGETEPWFWGGSSKHSGPGDPVTQDSFQSACDESHASVVSSPGLRSPQAPHVSKEWLEGLNCVQNAIANMVKNRELKCQEVSMKDQQSKAKPVVSLGPENSNTKLYISPKTSGAVAVSQVVVATGDDRASTQECQACPSTADASTETDCPACLDQGTQTTAAPRPVRVNQTVDASGDFRPYFTSAKECEAAPITTVASTEMDSPAHLDQDTQTTQASTAEKSVITEVFMTTVDFLIKEFCRLKSVDEELEVLKAKQLKPNAECGCECGQRLKQAELKLLALQYTMCKDACWRRYFISAQGKQAMQCPDRVPDSLAETLQALENSYSQMRRQVLSGVALDELTPLSVDTRRFNTEALYTPAQQHALSMSVVSHTKPESAQSSKAVSLKTQRPLSARTGVCEEGGNVTSEAWFDAEEDLGLAGHGMKEERPRKVMDGVQCGAVGDGERRKISSSCHLCITHLHEDVTEEDLLVLFEKYQPKEVCIEVVNKIRTASMTVSSPDTAEAAVRDLSGTSVHGQPIQVRHVSRPPAAVSEGDHTFKRPQAPPGPPAAPPGHVPTESVKATPPYNMLPRPLRCSIEKLVNISSVPTANGTYVPPRPPASTTSMGSFDTLMARLMERHPQVGRQKIVRALLELQAQHSGSLSGLPIRVIVEMASTLLTTQASGSN